jgi:pimeloyl-ACP methyl ester carboxylesterase
MASVYGTSVGARMIGRVFGMPDDESMDAFVATANATDPSAIKAIVDEVASQPLPDQLGAIRVPVLAVVGDKDTSLARAAVPVLMDRVPNARGARVPGVGHQWNAEAPELFTDMVRVWIEQSEIHPGLRPITA